MQKVLDFLERHVQWVAIAVAALFMLYAFSSYLPVVSTPVAVDINGQQLTPGEIDPTIRVDAEAIQSKMDAPTSIKIAVPDPLKDFNAKVTAPIKTSKLPPTMIVSQAVDQSGIPIGQNSSDPSKPQNNKVNDLPVLPAVVYDTPPTTDFAQVSMPPAPGQPAAAAAPAAAPGAPAAVPANAVDTTWVRVPFTVPAGNIARAFGDANIPGNLNFTSFLRVDLIRQKELPGGQWGPEEIVDPLPTLAIPSMPAEGAQNLAQQQQYSSWAIANQNTLVQPEFFAVLAGGDPRFTKPAVDQTASSGTAAAFDPETFPANGKLDTLTPEQRDAVLKVRQRRAKEAEQNRPPPQPGGGEGPPRGPRGPRGGGGGGGPRGMSAPGTPAPNFVTTFANAPLQTPANGLPPGDPGISEPGSAAGGTMPGFPAPGVPTQIVFTPVPNPGPWAPQSIPNGVIEGWAYDVTAAADSTYRYRVRYTLKNPIFGVQNVANNPALISVFGIVGEDKQKWSEPITIAPLTHIYLAALPQAGSPKVGFTVFRWQAGKRHRLTPFFAAPGDSIGKKDGDIDYSTHWTLVETRRDSSSTNVYALLMNADGVLKKVDFDADKATPLFQQLNAEVDGPPVAQPTPGGYPGGYPGGPPGGYPGGYPGGPPPGYPGPPNYPGAPGGATGGGRGVGGAGSP